MNYEGKFVTNTDVSLGIGFTLEAEFCNVGATMFGCEIDDETGKRKMEYR